MTAAFHLAICVTIVVVAIVGVPIKADDAVSTDDSSKKTTSTYNGTTPFPNATLVPDMDHFTFPDWTIRQPARSTTTPKWNYCTSTVFGDCFSRGSGDSRQLCGFNANTPRKITPNGDGGRSGCNQDSHLLQLLQAKGNDWNSAAVQYQLQLTCPDFRQTQACLDKYNSQCAQAYVETGLAAWMWQFSYICYSEGAFALVSFYNCTRDIRNQDDEDKFYGDCIRYAEIIHLDYKSFNVTDDMDAEDCTKFKAFVGCKAYQLISKCNKNMTIARAAAQFFIATINGAQKVATGNSTCKIANANDIDLAVLTFLNYRPKTTPSTSTRSTPTTTTKTTPLTTKKATTTKRLRGTTQSADYEDSSAASQLTTSIMNHRKLHLFLNTFAVIFVIKFF